MTFQGHPYTQGWSGTLDPDRSRSSICWQATLPFSLPSHNFVEDRYFSSELQRPHTTLTVLLSPETPLCSTCPWHWPICHSWWPRPSSANCHQLTALLEPPCLRTIDTHIHAKECPGSWMPPVWLENQSAISFFLQAFFIPQTEVPKGFICCCQVYSHNSKCC